MIRARFKDSTSAYKQKKRKKKKKHQYFPHPNYFYDNAPLRLVTVVPQPHIQGLF